MRASFLSPSFTGCATILLVFAMGCEPPTPALTPAGAKVRLAKRDAPPSCREVGTVESEGTDLPTAQSKLRNAAAELEANYLRWDNAKGSYLLRGTAFSCPEDVME